MAIRATRGTIRTLKKHFFNNVLWPDFSNIPSKTHPTIRFVELKPEHPTDVGGYEIEAVLVDHTVECAGFVIRSPDGTLGYSGDTGPTDRLWQVLREEEDLRALLMEVSFPNREQRLATVSGHHTPKTLQHDLRKFGKPKDLPTLLYHIKPVFQSEVEQQCARLKGLNLTVLSLKDQFVL